MVSRERVLDALLELTAGPMPTIRDDLLREALHTALPLVQAEGVTLVTVHHGRLEQRTRTVRGELEARPASRHGRELARVLLQRNRPLRVADAALDPRLEVEDGCPEVEAGPAVFVPLRCREHAPGYLAAFRRRGAAPFTPADARQLVLLAAWTALALENMRLASNVEKLAVTDDLTQVYNYRFLKTALRRELRRAARFEQELALIMLDVDNLKSYNDRNGHLRGSELLRELAALMMGQVRSFDLIAKYGGDEFTLILPQTGLEGAMVVAERMRRTVAEHAFALCEAGGITISLGAATFPRDAEEGLSLIRCADQALYLAKQRGRNLALSYRDVAERAGALR
ncbi:MAG TPA: sensor domain-containing diguanylate cyclase [Terriglobales bacterium]|nr:sensor domain-containing diguanylate cyclase [Terriglobales bacterium]